MQILPGIIFTDGISILQNYTAPAVAAPTFAISPSVSSVNEGANVTFNITGTNIPDRSTYYWAVQTYPTDFSQYVGSVEIINNAASFTISPTADLTTEGAEIFTVALKANTTNGTIVATSSSVTINDTSISPPSYTVTPAASNVNEGTALTFNVGGSYIIDGTYYWTVNNVTSSNTDFDATSGSFTITSNSGSFNVTANSDLTTEGAELYTASVRTGSITGNVVAVSSSVTINDTSVPASAYGSFQFTGGQEFIQIPYNVMLGQDGAFTTEFWWKHDTFYSTPAPPLIAMAVYGHIVLYSVGISSTNYTFYIAQSTQSSYDRGYVSSSLKAYPGPSVTITASNWNHWALTGDGTNLRLYCNGILCSGTPYNYSAWGGQPASSGVPLQIGVTGINNEGYLADFRHVRGTVVYNGNFTPPNNWLSPGGNASIYSSTANVNTTFSAANCGVLLQKFDPTNVYKKYDSSNYNAIILNSDQYTAGTPGGSSLNSIPGTSSFKPF